jgi:pimeloyl-ACP methyl ester carboxylesterase
MLRAQLLSPRRRTEFEERSNRREVAFTGGTVTFKRGAKYFAIFVVSVVVAAVLSAALYRYLAQRAIAGGRAIHSADGIDTLERVSIGGIDQWIEVRGQSVKNPLLLFIHGGPGSAFIPVARTFQDPWEKYFTVVQWDQRGAGKTYTSNSKDVVRPTMTIERMHADTVEMVNYLRRRFGRDKIFVLGHSWGSILGLQLAHNHPELLYAYIGVGQASDAQQNEVVLYRDTLAEARRTQNQEAIKQLTAIAPYPSASVTFQQIRVVREWSGALIGPPPSPGDESVMGLKTIFLAPEYSLMNDVDWMRGQLFSVEMLLPGLSKVNLGDLGYNYRVPVFFLEGKHDPYTPSSLAKELFDKINDPDKEFVWFENSGHFPFTEEPQKFTDALVQKVLPLAR